MRIFIPILFFYKKLILPSIAGATALSFCEYIMTGKFHGSFFAFSYILMTLAFQYVIYEKRNPNDYYFYFNLGLGKLVLWGTTLLLSMGIVLIGIVVCGICRWIV